MNFELILWTLIDAVISVFKFQGYLDELFRLINTLFHFQFHYHPHFNLRTMLQTQQLKKTTILQNICCESTKNGPWPQFLATTLCLLKVSQRFFVLMTCSHKTNHKFNTWVRGGNCDVVTAVLLHVRSTLVNARIIGNFNKTKTQTKKTWNNPSLS